MTEPSPVGNRTQVRLALSQVLQETAEYAATLVPTYADHHAAFGEHLTAARRLRILAERVIDAAIAVEAGAGADVDQIADWLALPVDLVHVRLNAVLARAAHIDAAPAAGELDAWYARVGGPDAPSDAVSGGLP